MKRFNQLIIFVTVGLMSFSDSVFAQSYTPFPSTNAIWNVTDAHLGFYNWDYAYDWHNWVYHLEGDTVIESKTYHKLFSDTHNYTVTVGGDTVSSGFSYHQYAGAIREDSFKHIFFRSFNGYDDWLLYDFNISIGDTTTTVSYYEAIVDSIDSFYVNNHWYTRFILHELYFGCENIYLMEGIGTSYGFINGVDCFEGLSVLNCFSENGIHIYGDSSIICDQFIWTPAEHIANPPRLMVNPNPFTTSTTITLTNYTAPFNLQLFDESGREVPLQYNTRQQNGRTTFIIDRSELRSGMYFLSVASGERREVMKVVVE